MDLASLNIKKWSLLDEEFDNCPILLGNGFSLNFSETLLYKNLYDSFFSSASKYSQKLFTEFDTTNFEIILQHLESTDRVLYSLSESSSKLQKTHLEIRQGLIDSIRRIHPTPDQISQFQIHWISKQFLKFSDIYTTNYDLFLYYIILETKKFGDYFYYKYFSDERFKLFNYGDSQNKNHIYYLHGALFLFEKGLETTKIKKDEEDWLIDKITKEIQKDNYPIFISEGSWERKLKAIMSNQYLSYCLTNFKTSEEKKLVVFGQSLSHQDSHLVSIIDNHYDKVAISIRPESWVTEGQLKAEKNRISSLFKKVEFTFFDSNTLFDFEPKLQF